MGLGFLTRYENMTKKDCITCRMSMIIEYLTTPITAQHIIELQLQFSTNQKHLSITSM